MTHTTHDRFEAGSRPGMGTRPGARDNARPAVAEWGTWGSPRSVREGCGAAPRLSNARATMRAPAVAEWGTWGPPRSDRAGFGASPRRKQ